MTFTHAINIVLVFVFIHSPIHSLNPFIHSHAQRFLCWQKRKHLYINFSEVEVKSSAICTTAFFAFVFSTFARGSFYLCSRNLWGEMWTQLLHLAQEKKAPVGGTASMPQSFPHFQGGTWARAWGPTALPARPHPLSLCHAIAWRKSAPSHQSPHYKAILHAEDGTEGHQMEPAHLEQTDSRNWRERLVPGCTGARGGLWELGQGCMRAAGRVMAGFTHGVDDGTGVDGAWRRYGGSGTDWLGLTIGHDESWRKGINSALSQQGYKNNMLNALWSSRPWHIQDTFIYVMRMIGVPAYWDKAVI